jgi:hypothetical protein
MTDAPKPILQKAQELISGERQDQYGAPQVCLSRIAQGWSIILGRKVVEHEVILCMDWLKSARLINNPYDPDSWVDKAGYIGLTDFLKTK